MKKKIAIISSIVLSALTVGTLTPLVFSQTKQAPHVSLISFKFEYLNSKFLE